MSIRYDDKFVKTPQLEIEYTSEMISDLVKCSQDIIYFLNFVTIVTLDGGRKKLGDLLYPFQKTMIEMCNDYRYLAFLCARQAGKSTTVGAFALWYAIFKPDKFIGIASNKASSSKDILRRVKIMYEELPFWLKPGVIEYNKQSIEFENGSKIETSATTEDTFRGRSINCLILDEFAFIPDGIARQFYASVYPAVAASQESKIIVISTPNGVFNLFHELYSGAENKTNDFKFLKVSWNLVPGRDEKWKKIQLKNLGQTRFNQEFACVSGDTIIEVRNKETMEIQKISIDDFIRLL